MISLIAAARRYDIPTTATTCNVGRVLVTCEATSEGRERIRMRQLLPRGWAALCGFARSPVRRACVLHHDVPRPSAYWYFQRFFPAKPSLSSSRELVVERESNRILPTLRVIYFYS
jgi:hypothetical protein